MDTAYPQVQVSQTQYTTSLIPLSRASKGNIRSFATAQYNLMAQNSRIRLASPQDIDSVTALFIKSLDDDENWDYRVPFRHEYPEDHWRQQKSYVEFMVDEVNDDFEVWILEVETSEASWKAVALSIWDVSYVNKRLHGPSYVMKQS
jgi:hypothetical protein